MRQKIAGRKCRKKSMITKRANIISIFCCVNHHGAYVCAQTFGHANMMKSFTIPCHTAVESNRRETLQINTFAMANGPKRDGEWESERTSEKCGINLFRHFFCVAAYHTRPKNECYGLQSIDRNEFQRCIRRVSLFALFRLGFQITFTRLCVIRVHKKWHYTRIRAQPNSNHSA